MQSSLAIVLASPSTNRAHGGGREVQEERQRIKCKYSVVIASNYFFKSIFLEICIVFSFVVIVFLVFQFSFWLNFHYYGILICMSSEKHLQIFISFTNA